MLLLKAKYSLHSCGETVNNFDISKANMILLNVEFLWYFDDDDVRVIAES